MEIRRYLAILRRRWMLVVAIVVAAVIAGWLVTPRTDTYTATSTLYVGSRSIDINPLSQEVSADRVVGLDRLIATFGAMAATRPIAVDAVEIAGVSRSPDQVIAETTAEQVGTAYLLDISVTDSDPAVSQALANAVASSLVEQVRAFEPRSADSGSGEVLSLYEQAELPGEANPKSTVRNLVLAGLFGILAAGALVALLEHLDITLRSAGDVERELELPVLAVVPELGKELPIAPTSDAESPNA